MKKIIALFVFIVTSSVYAQNSGITYQAVIYNPSTEILPGNNNPNVVLAEKNICLRFSISDANSSVEYQEVQKVKTDEFGMVNLIVGDGDQVSGYAANFDAIIWNSNNKNLKVEIDTNGNCTNFIEISNQKFASVPFAFASKVAETVSGIVPIVNGGTGAATVAGAKTNLGLNNVDNTSDLNKPVSTATQTALDAKAPLASPGFTGIPTAPTAAAGTSTTQIATTAFVNAALATAGSPDATATQKGRIQLAGDLGGTADAPRVPGLANKENAANKSTDTSLGNSDILFPTQKAVKTYVDNQVSSGVVDATTSYKGKIQLAGDLSGTADAPTVPGLLSKESTITAGTISQYFRGDKTWQTLDKTAVGLDNVDNTSDANKPVSSAVQTALNAKEDASNKSTDTLLGTSNLMFPTQNAVKTYVDNQIATSSTPEATSSVKGKIQLGGDLAGTGTTASAPKISAGAISAEKLADNAVTNAKLGEIVAIAKGGTGSNMNTTAGYVKQATTGANFTTVSSIPVTDVTGAVRSVNGVLPDNTTGNVSVLIGNVYTGSTITPTTGTTPVRSDIYIVSGQSGSTNDNGRTFIYDGSTWHEISTNIAALDNTFVKLSGSTMVGNLVFPAGKKIILNDAPSNATDAANKEYVDTKIGGSGTVNFVPKFSGTSPSKILENSSIFDDGTNVGIGTTTPTSKFETVGDMKARNSANTNSVVLNTGLPSVDFASSSRTFRLGSYTGSTYNSQIDGTAYLAGVSGITQLSLNTQGNQPITFATNDWIERMRIQHTTGNVGIGTNTPATRLHVNSASPATNTVNVEGVFRMQRPQSPGVKWENIAQFDLGSYSTALNATTRLDLSMNDGGNPPNPSPVMTWQANGNVGIGTTSPLTRLIVNDNAYIANIPTITANLMDNSTFRPLTRFQTTSGANNNAISHYLTTTTAATQAHNYSTGATLPYILQPAGGNVGIGTTTPSRILDVVNQTSVHTGVIEAETPVTSTTSRAIAIRMRRGTFSAPTAIQNGDVSMFAFSGYDGATFSPATAAIGGVATENWTSTNKGMALSFYSTPNTSAANNERMRIDQNGNIGVATTSPISLFSNAATGTNFVSSNSATQSATGISWLTNNAGYNTSLYNANNVVGSNGLQVKVANTSSQTIAFEVGQNTSQSGISNPYFNVLGNGNVGIGTNAPLTRLIVNDNTYIANLPSSSTNLMDNSTFRPLTRFQSSSGINNNAISHYLTTTAAATQAHNYSTGALLPYVLQPAGGNVGIGITAPSAQLHTTGSVRFAGAGTPAANRVLTSDASGNATWQSAPGTTSVVTRSANFALTVSDNAGFIIVNSASVVEVTVPSTLPAGFYCQIIQQGTGQVRLVGSGVTLNSALGFLTRAQGSSIGIMLATNTLGFVSGDTGL